MMRKKLDSRFKILIENGIAENHRSMFVVVGDKGKDLVPIIHTMLSKATIKARPTVLWAYKKELDLSSNRKKRMKQIQKKIKSGLLQANEDDPFEQFVACTQIRHCFYKDTHKILGNTYGMCVLQDFEALTPNLLARTVETVEGGGLIVLLLRSMNSLRQLHTLVMDVHARYRTESHQDVVGRFNERFLLSLADCPNCLVIDDQLNVLPISSKTRHMTPIPPKPLDEPLSGDQLELKRLKQQLLEEKETQLVAAVVSCCVTLDQAKAVLRFVEGIVDKSLRSTVVMTAARGRGKSAALGLGMACAVAYGYSNIYVTAPSPENLKTMYEFICKGFDALKYEEHQDYELIQSENAEFNKAVVRINICREHRQTIQYIHPTDAHKLGQAELVCIDEAAAIPLPLVKSLLGPYLVFMSSTINGYEGTGRSLSLKLLSNLRQKSNCNTGSGAELNLTRLVDKLKGKTHSGASVLGPGRSLYELALTESIRYRGGDPVERWLSDLLCLDVTDVTRTSYECIAPSRCQLVYVNRDTLFSYHRAAELFLKRLVSIYVASHYKNTPDDLQLLSDAPAHHIFCLIRPSPPDSKELPDIYCVIQVCLEGQISRDSIANSLRRGQRASGDLIPWTVSEQFQDNDFASLSGARIVRIATHPDMQRMGYGKRALELLEQYFENKIPSMIEDPQPDHVTTTVDKDDSLLEEQITPRQNLPPLLQLLSNRPPERLDYLGVSFGLTPELLKFWKNLGMTPVYIRQTANELTGEHSCIMLKRINTDEEEEEREEEKRETTESNNWLLAFWRDFRRRFVSLLSYDCFRVYRPQLALEILHQKHFRESTHVLSAEELATGLTGFDLNRLDKYTNNMVDYHLIIDLLPKLANLYFLNRLSVNLKPVQSALLVGIGLQHKTVDTLRNELDTGDGELKVSQLLAWFNQLAKILLQYLRGIQDKAIESEMVERKEIVMLPMRQSLEADLTEGAKDVEAKQVKLTSLLHSSDLNQYAIKGTDEAWSAALREGPTGIVSVVGKEKKRKLLDKVKDDGDNERRNKKFKKHQGDKKKKKFSK